MTAAGKLLFALGVFVPVSVLAQSPAQIDRTNSFRLATRGSGNAGQPDTTTIRLRARTMSGEEPVFREAIDTLDAQSGRVVRGTGLVPGAVSEETRVPVRTLIAQQAETGLSYGELLVADSLAVGSGQSFARILAMRAKTQTWAELSWKLRIHPRSLIARARGAVDIINDTEARYYRQRKETIYGLDVVRTQNSQSIPRPWGRGKPGG